MVGITELMLTPVADIALIAASKSDNQRAVEILDLATKLPEKLQHDANTELEKTRNKIDEFFDGVLVGLWHGLTEAWDTIFTIGGLPGLLIASGLGDEDARKQLDQLGKQLGSLDLGDFIDLADLKAGRYGEFVGQNLWWLVPIGKAGKLVKAADVAKAPEKARGVLSYVDEHNGAAPKGYKGNKAYDNDPAKYATPGQKPGEKLPETLQDGERISYTEYDVDPNLPGVPRNDERIVVGTDGSVRYTDDHFLTFTRIR